MWSRVRLQGALVDFLLSIGEGQGAHIDMSSGAFYLAVGFRSVVATAYIDAVHLNLRIFACDIRVDLKAERLLVEILD